MIKEEIEALLAEKSGQRPSNKCSALQVIDQFEGENREAMIRLFDSNLVTTKVLEYLATLSISINPEKITKHRRRKRGTGCSCPVEL